MKLVKLPGTDFHINPDFVVAVEEVEDPFDHGKFCGAVRMAQLGGRMADGSGGNTIAVPGLGAEQLVALIAKAGRESLISDADIDALLESDLTLDDDDVEYF